MVSPSVKNWEFRQRLTDIRHVSSQVVKGFSHLLERYPPADEAPGDPQLDEVAEGVKPHGSPARHRIPWA